MQTRAQRERRLSSCLVSHCRRWQELKLALRVWHAPRPDPLCDVVCERLDQLWISERKSFSRAKQKLQTWIDVGGGKVKQDGRRVRAGEFSEEAWRRWRQGVDEPLGAVKIVLFKLPNRCTGRRVVRRNHSIELLRRWFELKVDALGRSKLLGKGESVGDEGSGGRIGPSSQLLRDCRCEGDGLCDAKVVEREGAHGASRRGARASIHHQELRT
mmetsp:Transcript_26990/g.56710  ORF Transcript_26990/g.56710 Transcript_26990/m.56710 type:complete len:214 (-) Transcript_26990:782-1423(-)